ncbi:MAG: ParB/RepB/Spo0J family partition protein, partial [Candidatus Sungbacteria bacterium]|nr:ParB/RepB/Spo0J family partition protein [Candidatus Sungbacteria bacterium]
RFYDEPAGAASETTVRSQVFTARAASDRPLLPAASGRSEESIFWIGVGSIEPNPEQPRRQFDTDELLALASSIKEHGVLQPLLVTKKEIDTPSGLSVKYELLAGERRWRAAKLAGLREVPVIVRSADVSGRNKLEIALIENVQREDLNPLERARAFARLADEFGLMQKDIALRIGKSRETVTNALRILRLPEEIQAAIASNAISEGHARILLTLENNPERQRELFFRITAESLTVRDAELTAGSLGGRLVQRTRRRRGLGSTLDPDSRELQRKLEEVFGTRVSLIKKGEHGRIVVEFYSDEELRGILDRIAKREEGYV